jgi:hypothetical protein
MAASSQVYAPHDNFHFKDSHETMTHGIEALSNFFKK